MLATALSRRRGDRARARHRRSRQRRRDGGVHVLGRRDDVIVTRRRKGSSARGRSGARRDAAACARRARSRSPTRAGASVVAAAIATDASFDPAPRARAGTRRCRATRGRAGSRSCRSCHSSPSGKLDRRAIAALPTIRRLRGRPRRVCTRRGEIDGCHGHRGLSWRRDAARRQLARACMHATARSYDAEAVDPRRRVRIFDAALDHEREAGVASRIAIAVRAIVAARSSSKCSSIKPASAWTSYSDRSLRPRPAFHRITQH